MSVIHGNEKNFESLINKDLVLVDFFATWCGPCKMLGPVLESLENIDVVKIDVDECPDLARKYAIMSVPTLMIFSNGDLKNKQSGFMTKEVLEEWILENK